MMTSLYTIPFTLSFKWNVYIYIGRLEGSPTWHPRTDKHGVLLQISFEHSTVIWPWTGFLALRISVLSPGQFFSGVAEGVVRFTVVSPPINFRRTLNKTEPIPSEQLSYVMLPIKIGIVPTPSRNKRLLWDQFHSLGCAVL